MGCKISLEGGGGNPNRCCECPGTQGKGFDGLKKGIRLCRKGRKVKNLVISSITSGLYYRNEVAKVLPLQF